MGRAGRGPACAIAPTSGSTNVFTRHAATPDCVSYAEFRVVTVFRVQLARMCFVYCSMHVLCTDCISDFCVRPVSACRASSLRVRVMHPFYRSACHASSFGLRSSSPCNTLPFASNSEPFRSTLTLFRHTKRSETPATSLPTPTSSNTDRVGACNCRRERRKTWKRGLCTWR